MSAEIIEYVIEYRNIIKELNGLNMEIQNLRKKLKPRMDKLKKSKEKFEEIILKHLERQNDPGLKYQDMVLYKEPKKSYQHKDERQERLTQLLQQYNITDNKIIEKVMEVTKARKVINDDKFVLKLKNT